MATKFAKWQKRVHFISGEYPFTDGEVKIIRNDDGNMHCDYGPAYKSKTRCVWYQNGRKHGLDVDIFGSINYYFNGVHIPAHFFTKPDTITFEEVMNHHNAEVRRVGCEIYGFERMVQEGKLHLLDEDGKTGAQLYRINIPDLIKNPTQDDEPVVLVRVLDGTPNPITGERRVYFLKVPPTMTNCAAAIAWTFYKEPDTYAPSVET